MAKEPTLKEQVAHLHDRLTYIAGCVEKGLPLAEVERLNGYCEAIGKAIGDSRRLAAASEARIECTLSALDTGNVLKRLKAIETTQHLIVSELKEPRRRRHSVERVAPVEIKWTPDQPREAETPYAFWLGERNGHA